MMLDKSDLFDMLDVSDIADEPRSRIVKIGPYEAEELMQYNVHNRPLQNELVIKYAQDMIQGHWQLDGHPIRRSKEGPILDGQHRLAGVIRTGVTIVTGYVDGLDPEAQDVMDSGAMRTLGHVLALRGESYASQLGSAINWLYRYENGLMKSTGRRSRPTREQSKEVLARHPELRDLLVWGSEAARMVGLSAGAATFLFYILTRVDEVAAYEYIEKFTTGAGLETTDPRLRVRNTVMRARGNNDRVHKRTVVELLAYSVKAWNAWRKNKTIQTLRFTKDENFPTPQ
jgi:hypothetical protein